MHRTALAVTVGALLLSVSGCDGGSGPTAAPSATAGSATAPAATSPAATASAKPSPAGVADYRADTKRVCGKVDKLLEGREIERFAKELGKLIVYKSSKQTAKATAARDNAKQELKRLAAAVRRETAAAKDPGLKAAGAESAASIEKTAADNAFFAKVRTVKSINKNLELEMTPWLTPLGMYCA